MYARLLVFASAVTALVSCGESPAVTRAGGDGSISVELSPPAASMVPGASRTFRATVSGSADRAVTWTVVEGTAGGEVNEAGLYTAPQRTGTYHVRAVSVAAPAVSGTAVVSVKDRSETPGTPRNIYPTVAGGREWHLPDDANLNTDGEFMADQPSAITIVEPGPPTVYNTEGVGREAEIRLNVHSPSGKAWWRNVEMTAYFRNMGARGTAGPPHTELIVRGGFHTDSSIPKSSVNDGIPPPAGTVTWPWWAKVDAQSDINGSALGSSYHGNLYYPPGVGSPRRWAAVEKEISHVGGYCGQRGIVTAATQLPPEGEWFGEKFIVRNGPDGTSVRLELWIDPAANDTWIKVVDYVDQNGVGNDWSASDLDGTDAPPYSIGFNQIITWAGPYAGFRADNVSLDFTRLSVREIAPL